MSNRISQSSRCTTAMLTIPNEAIRVFTAPPETISQRNVEASTGVPSRAYLEAVRDPGFPLMVTRLGKLRIVNRAAFIAWLEKGAFGMRRNDDLHDDDVEENDGPEEEADDILDSLGFHHESPKKKMAKCR